MKRIPLYLSVWLLSAMVFFACSSNDTSGIKSGTYILSYAKKNNVETRMLDGVYFKVQEDSLISNVVNGERLSSFKYIGNTLLAESNERFDILEHTDTSLVLETIKNRNLFTMYLKPQ